MNELLTQCLDPYSFQIAKHRDGLQAVAEGFLKRPISMPLDVHELFQEYMTASETVIVPRLVLLQIYYDLNRAWENAEKGQECGNHSHVFKSIRDLMSRIVDMPSPFEDQELARETSFSNLFKNGQGNTK